MQRQYEDYRVFTEFWDALLADMGEAVRTLVANDSVHIIAIHGPQGAGKTLFARQLQQDFAAVASASQPLRGHELKGNTWAQIAGGRTLSWGRVEEISNEIRMHELNGESDWPEKVAGFARAGIGSVVFYDNAERAHFLRGLGYSGPTAKRAEYLLEAAQTLVDQTRTKFSKTLLVLLSNDLSYLEALKGAVDSQERDLMSIVEIGLPSAEEKERAVRTNINRLNPVSYWACIDKSPDNHREKVRDCLIDKATFPDAFEAVDKAFEASATRTGRPGKKNQLVLVTLVPEEDVTDMVGMFSTGATVEASHSWILSEYNSSGWADCLKDSRRSSLLESEWGFRSVFLGAPFVGALLAADVATEELSVCEKLVAMIARPGGHTWPKDSRQAYARELAEQADNWPSRSEEDLTRVSQFWAAGDSRAGSYESIFSALLLGYNTTTASEGMARPDWVKAPYEPCSIVDGAASGNAGMKRTANILEFTTTKNATKQYLNRYLATKLPNYAGMLEND